MLTSRATLAPQASPPAFAPAANPFIQRARCSCDDESDRPVQRRSASDAPDARFVPPVVREVLSRGGRPLPETLRGPMEERYHFDFSKVRVHHDREADDAARSVGAHAFTSGSHVVLRSGIDLQSGRGRAVLAHELAHVIQQGRGQRPASWIDGGAADPLEREADAMAAGDHAGPSPDGPAGVVQRDEDDSAPPAAPPTRDPSRFEQALTRLASMARLVPGLAAVADVVDVIRTAVDLWRRREELLQRLLDAIGNYVTTVPAQIVSRIAGLASSLGAGASEAVSCVARQIGALLESLAQNWRQVMQSLLSDLLLVPALVRAGPIIWDNVVGIVDDVTSGNLRSAVDRGVAITTEVNGIAGVIFLWYAILSAAGLTAAGSVEPGGGNAAGALAGLTIPQVLNIALIGSVVATEGTRVARGVQDYLSATSDAQRDEACRRIAEGVFTLTVTGTLFFVGPIIQRFARAIIQEAAAFARTISAELRGLFRTAAPGLVLDTGPVQFRGPLVEAPPATPQRPAAPTTVERPPVRPSQPTGEPSVAPGTARPSPQPEAQPRVGPGVAGTTAVAEHPSRRIDRCEAEWGLSPGQQARRHAQRPPINDAAGTPQITVSDAWFRLDRGVAPPAGQRTSENSRAWARGIGRSRDDAGHVIGWRFGGRNDYNGPSGNIFPQDLRVNRGLMVQLDRRAAELHAAECDVCVHLRLDYEAATALRPTRVEHTIMYRQPGSPQFIDNGRLDAQNP